MTNLEPKENPIATVRSEDFWKSELNENQWDAVRICDSPLLVIAGAGSGKTRVLTYKIAYLLEHGYEPWQILALTFTNKAAREMNDRIANIVGPGYSKGLWSGTFHSIFARILRAESTTLGFTSDFSIYDSSETKSLIKSIIKELGLDDKTYKASLVAGRISAAKNRLILPQGYATDANLMARDQRDNLGEIHRIYDEYFRRCRTAKALDFDDLLLYTFLLFDKVEDIRKRYAARFRYILVDEYQDTNYAQHAIVSLLTRDNHHICVVGDDAQSIYSFRGANIDNILQFHKQYPEAVTVKLEQNYRSTQNIVGAANSIIRHNKAQIEKTVFSKKEEGDHLLVMPSATDREEAAKVTGTIIRLHKNKHIDFNEIAILYRTNAQSRSFEDSLREHHLPYRIYGGLSFYQRKEIKDIISYFRLITNLDDEEAFKRIINYPSRGIGNTTLQKIFTASREHNISLWTAAEHPTQYGIQLNKGTLGKLETFCNMILEFRTCLRNTNAFDLALNIITTTGIRADLEKEDGVEGESKRENVEELLGAIRSFERDKEEESDKKEVWLSEFLQQSALQTDADEKDADETSRITLMTIHAAKGLEFDAVFVTGMEENIFPGQQAHLFPREMEEERRLFYVAVTRAKRFCYLSYAQSRYRYGSFEQSEVSPFVEEINTRFIREESQNPDTLRQQIPTSLRKALFDETPKRRPLPTPAFSSTRTKASFQQKASSERTLRKIPTKSGYTPPFSTPSCSLTAGTRIKHERFGLGYVVSVDGEGDNTKAVVEFAETGRKNLLLKFAKFKIVQT